ALDVHVAQVAAGHRGQLDRLPRAAGALHDQRGGAGVAHGEVAVNGVQGALLPGFAHVPRAALAGDDEGVLAAAADADDALRAGLDAAEPVAAAQALRDDPVEAAHAAVGDVGQPVVAVADRPHLAGRGRDRAQVAGAGAVADADLAPALAVPVADRAAVLPHVPDLLLADGPDLAGGQGEHVGERAVDRQAHARGPLP